MKKVFFTISFLMLLNLGHSQWTNNGGKLVTNETVAIGEINNGSHYYYNLWHSNYWDAVSFYMKNAANSEVFSVFHGSSNTYIALRNGSNSELFKVSTLGNANTMMMHLPKADSRVTIGAFGDYLLNEGHKLIVKDGSAKIEGNIFSTGNIGIGTMSFIDGVDTYKLSVEGKVRAHGVKVYTDWADYVFDDFYELPTLKEVESYIEKNGHLKDIPSAEEVEENGIELGEMNKLLLQKIEELTLYTIQLKKEVDELKSKIN